MNNLKLFVFVGIAYFSTIVNNAIAQQFLNTTPIILITENFKNDHIISVVEKNKRFFTENEIASIFDSIILYNSDLDMRIKEVVEQRQEFIELRQQLLQHKNYVKLTEQLAEAEANYDELISDIKKNLQTISYKGFYICAIKDISPLDDPEYLIEQAKTLISPVAIRDIRGILIQSVTDLYRKEGFDDQLFTYIREEFSGKIEVEAKFNHSINPAERVFWYACKVAVSPLDEAVESKSIPIEDENNNIILINALKETEVKKVLTSNGIKRSIANEIDNLVKNNRNGVESENSSIKLREYEIIRKGKLKLIELNEKIETIRLSINKAEIAIKYLIEEKINLKYNDKSMLESLNNADKFLQNKIYEQYNLELELRNKKLQTEWDKLISTPGNPKHAISNTVVDLKKQIETNYGKIEQFIEIAELINDDLSVTQGRKILHQREVERMWVFIEPQSVGFKLHTVANLKIVKSNSSIENISTGLNQNGEKPGDSKPNLGNDNINKDIELMQSKTIEVGEHIIEMIGIKGSTFTMGCTPEQGSDCWSNEIPTREITIGDYYIGMYEVTQALWEYVMSSTSKPNNPSHFKGCDYCPVENVSWQDAKAFITKLNQLTGESFRLPTEAEWEYAARGGASTSLSNPTKYAGSNTIDDVAWYYNTSQRKTSNIGQNKPNGLGIYDMSGNVSEWCEDDWGIYNLEITTDKAIINTPRDSRRVHRGGSWKDEMLKCRVTSRGSESPWIKDNGIGFRLAMSVKR